MIIHNFLTTSANVYVSKFSAKNIYSSACFFFSSTFAPTKWTTVISVGKRENSDKRKKCHVDAWHLKWCFAVSKKEKRKKTHDRSKRRSSDVVVRIRRQTGWQSDGYAIFIRTSTENRWGLSDRNRADVTFRSSTVVSLIPSRTLPSQ